MARTGVVLLLAALALVAPASEPWAAGLGDCEELYLEAQFDLTRRCVERELARLDERPTAIRDAYVLLAATELAADRQDDAQRAVDVALAIDPAFQPNDPMLRAPRILALFSQAGPPVAAPPRGLFPLSADELPRGEVRFAARIEGVHPPLQVALRYRMGGLPTGRQWRQAALAAPEGAAGPLAATLRPPEEATSIETQFVVQTPDGVTVFRAAGPTVRRAPLRVAPILRRASRARRQGSGLPEEHALAQAAR